MCSVRSMASESLMPLRSFSRSDVGRILVCSWMSARENRPLRTNEGVRVSSQHTDGRKVTHFFQMAAKARPIWRSELP